MISDLAVGDRQVAVGVVEEERDLGDVDRPARRRALEDHVLHLAAAEQPGRLLAQHPAHRVGDVRLAAAVGPDDGGDALARTSSVTVSANDLKPESSSLVSFMRAARSCRQRSG